MVSITAVSSSASTGGTKPRSAAELAAEIAKLEVRRSDYQTELKELEAEPVKSDETNERIAELRDLIRAAEKQIEQRQVALDALEAEKRQQAGNADAGETDDAAASEANTNPYAPLLKTDLSSLNEAAKSATADPLHSEEERLDRRERPEES